MSNVTIIDYQSFTAYCKCHFYPIYLWIAKYTNMEHLMIGCSILFILLLIGYLFTHFKQVLVWSVIICVGICAIIYNAIFWISLGAIVLIIWGYAIHYLRLFITKIYKKKTVQ